MALSLVKQVRAGVRMAQELKNSHKPYKVTKVTRQRLFSSFTLGLLWVMAFAGLNITNGRANGIMLWLLMVAGKLYY